MREAASLIREINLGATAIGTGLNTPPEYSALAIKRLAEDSRSRVEEGVRIVADTGRSAKEAETAVDQMNELIGRISVAVQQQSGGIGEVNGMRMTMISTSDLTSQELSRVMRERVIANGFSLALPSLNSAV